ncbi:MAG: zinc ribbon domain-containing protein [Gammaproteobacteria bacterium]|nr:zinc ribbon domain-containing protein [Gammaproteobacteria bacterium]
MPTYSYRCEGCGHELEVVQRMTEDALTDCPACKAPKLVKQIQPVGFALKGTGWYVTDFRDKGKKPASSTPESSSGKEPAAAPSAGATETKTETPKPAAASTTD